MLVKTNNSKRECNIFTFCLWHVESSSVVSRASTFFEEVSSRNLPLNKKELKLKVQDLIIFRELKILHGMSDVYSILRKCDYRLP